MLNGSCDDEENTLFNSFEVCALEAEAGFPKAKDERGDGDLFKACALGSELNSPKVKGDCDDGDALVGAGVPTGELDVLPASNSKTVDGGVKMMESFELPDELRLPNMIAIYFRFYFHIVSDASLPSH